MYRRKPAVAGSFYPSGARELESVIDRYLAEAEGPGLTGKPVAVVSPHAGYVYSGPVAAYSYRALIDSGIELVVALAPSHRARFAGAALAIEGTYETPLGAITIDTQFCSALSDRKGFAVLCEAHDFEHSLEVQLPFLQKVLPSFKLAPVIVGTADLDDCEIIAAGLAEVLATEKRRTVIVISTDLSHYYTYDQAVARDGQFIEALKKFDARELKRVISSGKADACGEGPVLAGMIAARKVGAEHVEILKYANSGDTSGARDQVVGYLSAAMVE